jgi:hypothetical protein
MDAQNSHDEPNVEENALDTGNRWLELVPLDKNGSPLAAPIAITRRDRHVLAYDLASLADGSALLAF